MGKAKRARKFAAHGNISKEIKRRRTHQKKKQLSKRPNVRDGEEDRPRKNEKSESSKSLKRALTSQIDEKDPAKDGDVEGMDSAKQLESMDIDQFLEANFAEGGSDSEEDKEEQEGKGDQGNGKRKGRDNKTQAKTVGQEAHHDDEDEVEELFGSEGESEEQAAVEVPRATTAAKASAKAEKRLCELAEEVTSHQAQLEKLKEKDPDFFKFLQDNDQDLLEFDEDESDEDAEDEADEEDEGDDGEDASERRQKSEGSSEVGSDVEMKDRKTRKKSKDTSDGKDDASESAAKPTPAVPSTARGVVVLTKEMVVEMAEGAVKRGSMKSLKRLLAAFREGASMAGANTSAAAATGEAEEEDGSEGSTKKSKRGGKRPAVAGARFRIIHSGVFQALMVTALRSVAEAFDKQIQMGLKKKKKNTPRSTRANEGEEGEEGEEAEEGEGESSTKLVDVTVSESWPRLRLLARGFLRDLTAFVSHLSGAGVTRFTLRQLPKYLSLLAPFRPLCRRLMRALLQLWSSSSDDGVRLLSFIALRQMAARLPYPFLEECLKGAYLTYVRNAKFVKESSLPAITLMGNCLVELFGLDLAAAYRHAFVYIRQLALHLRRAVVGGASSGGGGGGGKDKHKDKDKDSSKSRKGKQGGGGAQDRTPLRNVCNWQYLNCLRLWTAVLSAYPGEGQLRPLFYPLAQVVSGTAALVGSAQFLPLKLHCARLLQQLAVSADLAVPAAPLFLSMLSSEELQRKPRAAVTRGGGGVDLELSVRLPEAALATKAAKDALVSRALQGLADEAQVLRGNVALPEIATPLLLQLKRFAGKTRVHRWKVMARAVAAGIEKEAQSVRQRREAAEFAPADADKVAQFNEQGRDKDHRQRLLAKLVSRRTTASQHLQDQEKEQEQEQQEMEERLSQRSAGRANESLDKKRKRGQVRAGCSDSESDSEEEEKAQEQAAARGELAETVMGETDEENAGSKSKRRKTAEARGEGDDEVDEDADEDDDEEEDEGEEDKVEELQWSDEDEDEDDGDDSD